MKSIYGFFFVVECTPLAGSAKLSCSQDTLTVTWPTNVVYNGSVSQIPATLYNDLTDRLLTASKHPILDLVIVSNLPP